MEVGYSSRGVARRTPAEQFRIVESHGKRTRNHEHPALKFFVGDEVIEVHTKTLTVKEILDDAGYKPPGDYYLLHGKVKYENLDQTVELHGGESFDAKRRKEEYSYFVDGEKYESAEAYTTGAIIKSKLPEAKRGYALYLEGHGNEPDVSDQR